MTYRTVLRETLKTLDGISLSVTKRVFGQRGKNLSVTLRFHLITIYSFLHSQHTKRYKHKPGSKSDITILMTC